MKIQEIKQGVVKGRRDVPQSIPDGITKKVWDKVAKNLNRQIKEDFQQLQAIKT